VTTCDHRRRLNNACPTGRRESTWNERRNRRESWRKRRGTTSTRLIETIDVPRFIDHLFDHSQRFRIGSDIEISISVYVIIVGSNDR
jgi:hypothetical protein